MIKPSKIAVIIGLTGLWVACATGVFGAERSPVYQPAVLRGVNFDPKHPYDLEFLVDSGSGKVVSKEEVAQLVRYFLAGLTIPREKLWVNLSPYEPQRIIDDDAVQTELGDVFLEQDYALKQFAAALTNPASETGKRYWEAVNGVGAQRAVPENKGVARCAPTNSFNKIWIIPDKADIQESGNGVFISEASLRVMMDDRVGAKRILPLIEQEVNTGKRFAALRQVYNSLLLSFWFKQKISGYLYSRYYDRVKVNGIDLADPKCKENTYVRYLYSFKNGTYDLIKTDYDVFRHKRIKRRYFSGGIMIPSGWQPRLVLEKTVWQANARVHLKVLTAREDVKRQVTPLAEESMEEKLTRLKNLLRDGEVYLQRLRYDILDGENQDVLRSIIAGQHADKLFFLQIDSVGCDSFCLWCMGGSRGEYAKGAKKNLSKEELIKLFDDIYAQGYRPMIRWGAWVGEPLMGKANHAVKLEAMEHAARLGFKQILITNGHYLSSDTWGVLAECMAKVNISLDAGNDIINRQLKPGEAQGVWEEKMDNVKGLIDAAGKIKSKLKVSVSYILHPLNIDQLDPDGEGGEFFTRLKRMGVSEFIVKAAHNEENARLSPDQVRRAYRFITAAKARFNDKRFQIVTFQDEEQTNGKMIADEQPDFPRCYTATWQAALALDTASGSYVFHTCCQYPVGTLGAIGSIEGQSFAALWHSDKRKEALQRDPRIFCRQCSPTDLYLNRLMNMLAEIYAQDQRLCAKIITAIFDDDRQTLAKIIDEHIGGIDFRLIGQAAKKQKTMGVSLTGENFSGFEVDAASVDNV